MPVLLVLWFPGRITEVILNQSFIQVSDYVFYHVSTFFSCLCFFTSWLAIIVIIKCQTTFRSHSFVMLRLSIYDSAVFFFFSVILDLAPSSINHTSTSLTLCIFRSYSDYYLYVLYIIDLSTSTRIGYICLHL